MILSISYPYPLPPTPTLHNIPYAHSHPPSLGMESYAVSEGARYERGDNTDVYKD